MSDTIHIKRLAYVRPVFLVEIMNCGTTLTILCEHSTDPVAPGTGKPTVTVCITGMPEGPEPNRWTLWEFPVSPELPEVLAGAIQALKDQVKSGGNSYHQIPKETSFHICSWLSVGWDQTEEGYWGFLEFRSEGRAMRADVCGVEVMEDFATAIAEGMTGA